MDQGTDPVTGRTADARIDTTQTSTDPGAIADDIRETRAEMDETIGALSAKLDPSNLIDQAKDAFTSSARDAGTSMLEQVKDSSFLDTIKDNPIPAAAVGLSVAWFLSKMGESESERYRYERYRETGDPYYAPRRPSYRRYDTYGTYSGGFDERSQFGGAASGGYQNGDPSLADKASDALDSAKSKASSALDSAQDTASDAVDAVKDTLRSGADASRDQAHQLGRQADRYQRQASSWLDRQMSANPLAIGAVALAAGALVGLSVPETDAEHQAFGDQADRVKNQLAQTAQDKAEDVKSAAKDVAEEAKAEAQSVADEAADKGQAVADKAADRAKKVAGEAEDTASKAADQATSGTASTSSKESTFTTKKSAAQTSTGKES